MSFGYVIAAREVSIERGLTLTQHAVLDTLAHAAGEPDGEHGGVCDKLGVPRTPRVLAELVGLAPDPDVSYPHLELAA